MKLCAILKAFSLKGARPRMIDLPIGIERRSAHSWEHQLKTCNRADEPKEGTSRCAAFKMTLYLMAAVHVLYTTGHIG